MTDRIAHHATTGDLGIALSELLLREEPFEVWGSDKHGDPQVSASFTVDDVDVSDLSVGHTNPLRRLTLTPRRPTFGRPNSHMPTSSGLRRDIALTSDTAVHTSSGDAAIWIVDSSGGWPMDQPFRYGIGSGAPRCSGQCALVARAGVEPLDEPVSHPRVVEQGEMMRTRQVLERGAVDDRTRAADTGRRREVHQQVTEHGTQRMPLRGAERGGDEVVLRVRQRCRGDAIETPLPVRSCPPTRPW